MSDELRDAILKEGIEKAKEIIKNMENITLVVGDTVTYKNVSWFITSPKCENWVNIAGYSPNIDKPQISKLVHIYELSSNNNPVRNVIPFRFVQMDNSWHCSALGKVATEKILKRLAITTIDNLWPWYHGVKYIKTIS